MPTSNPPGDRPTDPQGVVPEARKGKIRAYLVAHGVPAGQAATLARENQPGARWDEIVPGLVGWLAGRPKRLVQAPGARPAAPRARRPKGVKP